MNRKQSAVRCWIGAFGVLFLCLCLALTACGREEYDFSSTVIHTDATTERTAVDFSAVAGVYFSEFTMRDEEEAEEESATAGVRLKMYLMITEEGNFAFSRNAEFSSTNYGYGALGTYNETEPIFIYFSVAGSNVEAGSRVARYEVTEEGEIRFLSPIWYGSRIVSDETEEGELLYPVFAPYTETDTSDLTMNTTMVQAIESVRAETTTARSTTAAQSETTGTTRATQAQQTEPAATAARTTAARTTSPRTTSKRIEYTYTYRVGEKKKTTTTAAPKTTQPRTESDPLTAPEEDTTAEATSEEVTAV